MCCLKIETNFVEKKGMNEHLLYFSNWGFTDLLLSFWFDGISRKRKNHSIDCSVFVWCVKFLLVPVFRLFWEEISSPLSVLRHFCHQAICVHSLLHPQPNVSIWKKLRYIWCADTKNLTTFSGKRKSFQLSIQQRALCCCHCCGREYQRLWLCRVFLACTNGRSFLLQDFRHKIVV